MHICYKRFLHNLGTACSLTKTTFRAKINRVWSRKASKKFGPPSVFLYPLKLATSNLVAYQ